MRIHRIVLRQILVWNLIAHIHFIRNLVGYLIYSDVGLVGILIRYLIQQVWIGVFLFKRHVQVAVFPIFHLTFQAFQAWLFEIRSVLFGYRFCYFRVHSCLCCCSIRLLSFTSCSSCPRIKTILHKVCLVMMMTKLLPRNSNISFLQSNLGSSLC